MAPLPRDIRKSSLSIDLLDHRGVVGTGSLFNPLVVLPHFMSLAVIEPVRPSYSNRVSCSLQIVGRSSILIPQQFWYDYYCSSPSVAFFTFNSYSLITVLVTATAANLLVVDNNGLPFLSSNNLH
jgi:hypothetical protein